MPEEREDYETTSEESDELGEEAGDNEVTNEGDGDLNNNLSNHLNNDLVVVGMVGMDEVTEGIRKQLAPLFDEDVPPDSSIQLVLNGWEHLSRDQVIIQTHVASFTIESQVKREGYNEVGGATVTYEPVNLKCDIIVDKVTEKIKLSRGDLGIVGEVVQRAGRELDLDVSLTMSKRLEDIQAEARAKSTRIKEGGYPQKQTQTQKPGQVEL